VSYRFTGAPDPETAAAVVACIEAALGDAPAQVPARTPAWRQAGIRDNLAPFPAAVPGANWHATQARP
jgi:hypothetical protein